MIRYLRYGFLAVLAVVLVTVALANRQIVSLQALPEEMARFAGFSGQIQLPLFLVIFGGIIAGLLIGFVWEWIREYRQRAEAARMKREVGELKREVGRLRGAAGDDQDDVLALLEDASAAR